MKVISYTAARNKLADTMNEVTEDHAPVIITRQKGKPVVMISLEDFNAYEETTYLLRSPRNAARLAQALEDAESGRVETHELAE